MCDALYCVFMSARLPLTIKRFTYLLTYLLTYLQKSVVINIGRHKSRSSFVSERTYIWPITIKSLKLSHVF